MTWVGRPSQLFHHTQPLQMPELNSASHLDQGILKDYLNGEKAITGNKIKKQSGRILCRLEKRY